MCKLFSPLLRRLIWSSCGSFKKPGTSLANSMICLMTLVSFCAADSHKSSGDCTKRTRRDSQLFEFKCACISQQTTISNDGHLLEELTRFLKANNLFLSMPGRQDSRICSAVKRTVLVWASKIVLLKIMPRRSGSETKKSIIYSQRHFKNTYTTQRYLGTWSTNLLILKSWKEIETEIHSC